MGWLPQIPVRLLPDTMSVRVPDGEGFADAVTISHVRFVRTQAALDDAHRSADAGSGRIYIDAVNSPGGFQVPVGSLVEMDGVTYTVWKSRACEDFGGRVHHWEVDFR